jgi:hypothetical protein
MRDNRYFDYRGGNSRQDSPAQKNYLLVMGVKRELAMYVNLTTTITDVNSYDGLAFIAHRLTCSTIRWGRGYFMGGLGGGGFHGH